MRILVALLLVAFMLQDVARAQDTTIVQTLEFSDITKRRGWYVFPSDTGSYRKVLMYYTLKCDPATTQDQYACGEWDYTTYTNLYDYKNVGDNYYTVNGSAPDTVFYASSPGYDYYQSYDYFIVYDNVISENYYSVGGGVLNSSEVLQSNLYNGRTQYVVLASELQSAGLTAGTINRLQLDVTTVGDGSSDFTVEMRHTPFSQLDPDAFEDDSLELVYHGIIAPSTTGLITIDFETPFTWDGTSNIVVDFGFNNNSSGSTPAFAADITTYNSGVHSTQSEGYLDFKTPDYIEVPVGPFANLDSFITVSFWQYGDPNIQPSNDYLFEGRDSNGYRVINSHLPWSNGEVYWDAGNSGTNSYDRINQPANTDDYAGKWNYWALTKNVATGEMKMYLNGSLWLSGTGKTRTMGGITTFKIAGRANQDGEYDGFIDEFRVWDEELDQATIQAYMHKSVDVSHPYYSNLLMAYHFDEISGTSVVDYGPNGNNAQMMGYPERNWHEGESLNFNMQATNMRPNMVFVQGVYNSHLDSIIVTDSIPSDKISIVEQSTSINLNNTGITYQTLDTITAYAAEIWTYTYDPNGNIIDSTFHGNEGFYVNTVQATTHQIQNYVTPYGIGLDLGPNGFRWVYEVTDYLPLLHDTLEISAGNQQELIDLKFVFIHGTPPRDVVDFETIWLGDYQHSDIANDIVMPAVDVQLNQAASMYTVKTRTTGHWFGDSRIARNSVQNFTTLL